MKVVYSSEQVVMRLGTHSLRLRRLEDQAATVERDARGPQGEQGEPGPQGARGPKGDTGDVGRPPKHRWVGDEHTSLQFERPDGAWGEAVNLRGPQGFPGGVGVVRMPAPQAAANGAFTVPIHIPAGERFVVPPGQTLYSMTINVEGILELDGFLVQV